MVYILHSFQIKLFITYIHFKHLKKNVVWKLKNNFLQTRIKIEIGYIQNVVNFIGSFIKTICIKKQIGWDECLFYNKLDLIITKNNILHFILNRAFLVLP